MCNMSGQDCVPIKYFQKQAVSWVWPKGCDPCPRSVLRYLGLYLFSGNATYIHAILIASLSKSTCRDGTLVACHRPWWEYLHHKISKGYRSGLFPLPGEPVVNHLPAQHQLTWAVKKASLRSWPLSRNSEQHFILPPAAARPTHKGRPTGHSLEIHLNKIV